MKLKTKLIPLASLAVMSASVAPISLTSCNTNPYIGRSFNVCKPFYPTIEKHAHGSFDRYTIHHDYVKQLKKDLTTFVQDFM
ncbi:MAG: hypothetical protein MJ233_01005 [Mycoplasmoidaceae bacterium]|nr:hypothetical protein [Mycoplasmoidaceae bacterium]